MTSKYNNTIIISCLVCMSHNLTLSSKRIRVYGPTHFFPILEGTKVHRLFALLIHIAERHKKKGKKGTFVSFPHMMTINKKNGTLLVFPWNRVNKLTSKPDQSLIINYSMVETFVCLSFRNKVSVKTKVGNFGCFYRDQWLVSQRVRTSPKRYIKHIASLNHRSNRRKGQQFKNKNHRMD